MLQAIDTHSQKTFHHYPYSCILLLSVKNLRYNLLGIVLIRFLTELNTRKLKEVLKSMLYYLEWQITYYNRKAE